MKNNSALLLSVFFKPFILQTITPMPMKRIILFSICAMAMMLCHAQTTVRVKKAGTLETVLSASQQDTCRHLIVKGKLNSADLQVLRRMAGWADGAGRTGQLHVLDLRGAHFVKDAQPFLCLDARDVNLLGLAQPKTVIERTDIGDPLWGDGLKKRVRRFRPIYYLGKEIEQRIGTWEPFSNNTKDFRVDEYAFTMAFFDFTLDVNDKCWDVMREANMTKFPGHRVVKRADNGYLLQAYSQKKAFSPITFYGCQQLRRVFLPQKISFSPDIYDLSNRIRYYIGDELFMWDRYAVVPKYQKELIKQMYE